MTSFSKIFKAAQISIVDDIKVIPISQSSVNPKGEEPKTTAATVATKEHLEIDYSQTRKQMLEKAQAEAQAIIASAEKNAQVIEQGARADVEQWWEENRLQLDNLSQEARQQGYQEGFEQGKADATVHVQQEYEAKIAQVQDLLNQAQQEKQAIIAEAEPFLLELSTTIAAQIIKQELETHPDKFVEFIKQHLLRFKEKEFITVCVHPDDYEFIQSQRTHLISIVNGETEINILPDHTITPKGCIIRTAYGSVDARIDTQLEEVKKVLLAAGRVIESETNS